VNAVLFQKREGENGLNKDNTGGKSKAEKPPPRGSAGRSDDPSRSRVNHISVLDWPTANVNLKGVCLRTTPLIFYPQKKLRFQNGGGRIFTLDRVFHPLYYEYRLVSIISLTLIKYMKKSSAPIIDHIPLFLNYCKEIGLSEKTYENYKHYLNKFIFWLKKENKNTLLPHQLTAEDAQVYKAYLSQYTDGKGRFLKKVTQNYYLIALRALLSYFTAKDVVSLLTAKISLPRGLKREKIANFLNQSQIEAIFLAPDLKTQKGLRDRAILEVLITTGLKIRQITNLNRDQLPTIPREALTHIGEYLQTRKDKNNAFYLECNRKYYK